MSGDPEEDVVLGREIRVRRRKKVGALVAIRMSREMLVALDEYARSHDMNLSETIREAVDRLLHPQPSYTRSSSAAETHTWP